MNAKVCLGWMMEGVAKGEEGWLWVEVAVEGEGALGEMIFARAESLEPGIAVREAPG